MPRKTRKTVEVVLDRPHEMRRDAATVQTLPAGWTGTVSQGEADRIVASGAGRLVLPENLPEDEGE